MAIVGLLAPHERRDRRRDADAAHEQAGEADEPEVHRELREEPAQPRLCLVEGRHAHAGIADPARQVLALLAGGELRRQLHQRPVTHAAAELDQPAPFQRLGRHEDARPERHQAGGAIGLGLDHARAP